MTPAGLEDEEEETSNISIIFLAKDSNAHDWGTLTSLQNEVIESEMVEKGT